MNLPHPHLYGLLGEFDTPKQLITAAKRVRDAGYHHIDAFAPFPVEGLSQALGLGRRQDLVPLITIIGGLAGGLGGFFFQLWVDASADAQTIDGRPSIRCPALNHVAFYLTLLAE